MKDLPILTADALLDNAKNYKYTHHIIDAIQSGSILESTVITDIDSIF